MDISSSSLPSFCLSITIQDMYFYLDLLSLSTSLGLVVPSAARLHNRYFSRLRSACETVFLLLFYFDFEPER